MNIKSWEVVKELLHQAMQLDPPERARFLDEACASDHTLRAELESLLSADKNVRSSFLQSRVAGTRPEEQVGEGENLAALQPGQIFDQRFQLVSKIGEGGMGQVWLAEQTSPVRRSVALKLIRAGMYDEEIVRRFQSERQSLAVMDHAAIAKVFEAGTSPQGQPYFVMEYVPGLPITEYCDRNKLKIRDRLELFIQACEGVQHAHRKAIIHRDLKPANILVVEVDGRPVPRIIDFGLAKATTPQADGQSLFTRVGHFVGTPGYISPEQADPNIDDIDTRTDVYSLGVVLYELLSGSRPFDPKQGGKQPLDELLRKLREEEPPIPSAKVSTGRNVSSATAEARSTEPRQLINLLRGDLDRIAMKALEKDRSRRYGSPSELAADIRRYLNHQPVLAVSANAGYRIRKYVHRHRLVVGIAASLALLLAAFLVFQQVQIGRISRERDRANRERDRANRVATFMSDIFMVPDPSQARGNSITAREILDKASTEIAGGLAKDPDVQSQMMLVMARTYLNLGLYARAHELAQGAWDARLSHFGPDDPKTLESMALLGWCMQREGHFVQAEKLEVQALEGQRRALGSEHPKTLETMGDLGYTWYLEGRYAEAEKLHRQVVDLERRVLGLEHRETSRSMSMLALDISQQGRYAEAEKLHREALEMRRRVFGPENPFTVLAMYNLAQLLHLEQRYAEAEKFEREELEIERRILGPEHPNTLRTMDSMANEISEQGRYAEAEKMKRETLAIQRRVLGTESPETALTMSNLAALLDDEAHYAEAEQLEREALDIERHVLGSKHPQTVDSIYDLACYTARNGKRNEALALLREAVDNGYHKPLMATDPDLKSLHGDPRFEALIAYVKQRKEIAP
jgi:non-specific serine/threonine protein kinase/serine/threonine-protein kinase